MKTEQARDRSVDASAALYPVSVPQTGVKHVLTAVQTSPLPALPERFMRLFEKTGPERAPCYYRHGLKPLARGSNLSEPQVLTKPPELTVDLLRLARDGDRGAMNRLFERLGPPLQRWARGRLPGWARSMVSTVDLVQETLFSTFKVIEKRAEVNDFEVHAYVRQSLKHRLIDELRKVQRRPVLEEMHHTHGSDEASPLEQAIGGEALERYEAALARIEPESRDAVLARIELGLSWADIATMLGKNSPDAARMMVSRALVQLAEAMSDD